MPSIMTHTIFAQEALQHCDHQTMCQLIQKHLHLYHIGANGPDFLFYSNMLPWRRHLGHHWNAIGNALHAGHVNAFYTCAWEQIDKQTDQEKKEKMFVYYLGHLTHWVLDMKIHPFVFYFTGDGKGQSANWHHRFEAVLDAWMQQEKKTINLHKKPYEICYSNSSMQDVITCIYQPVIRKIFEKELEQDAIQEALHSWKWIQRFFYHTPQSVVRLLLQIEKWMHKPYALTGFMIPKHAQTPYDEGNAYSMQWHHPCDVRYASTASFLDLYEEALKDVEHLFTIMDLIWNQKAEITELCHELQDRAYDTGRNDQTPMHCFMIKYERGMHHDM